MPRSVRLVVFTCFLACPGPRASAEEVPSTVVAPSSPVFAPRARGLALETGFALRAATTPLSTNALGGSLFIGYKTGALMVGLGLQLSGSLSLDALAAAALTLSVAPGVRVTLLRSADRKVELFGQLDVGVSQDFGVCGPGCDVILGLPPGATLGSNGVAIVGEIGPGLRYWMVPQLALAATMLARGDWSQHTFGFQPDQSRSTRFDFNISVGFRVLLVL